MYKKTAWFLGIILAATALGGCKSNLPKDNTPGPSSTAQAPEQTSGETQGSTGGTEGTEGLKTGMAVITSISGSKDAGEEDGLAQVDSTVVALTLDENGRIADCIIDAVQAKISFSKDGRLLTDKNSEIKTKNELGEAYGMKKASGIGREWNEQANAMAEYVIGKTVDEVNGIAVNEEGRPSDTDLASSVTISIGGFKEAITKAAGYAKEIGARKGDKLGLGILTGIESSGDASEEADGIAQADSAYTVTTTGDGGRITSCIIDGSQARITFSKEGKITSDLSAYVQTKNEMGDAYGMRKASGIGKEWNEEAAAFAEYVTGKTLDEVKGIAVNEKGAPSDADLTASVTIAVGDFVKTIEKAAAYAR